MDLDQITDDMHGAYRVRTASGTLYCVDLDSVPRTVVRLAEDLPPTDNYKNLTPSELRKDGDEIPLLGIVELAVGMRGAMWLDIRNDGVSTFRDTTPVLSISRLAGRP
ncbi:hypothetical protein [Pseudarthrobacter sp. PH31-O2]|uniref:hypothetical protein n=1 Tax=Pseudarthrobacter sp. PH31-O2 TaxID=3046206 RepID=UPI0024BB6669|nr:hypothetical protein [Pseudarthrobacter sp. PH31-O2]MDJ0354406.1 hypothetical protein [Pseudarthrobacter sp. PH31-O2]